MGKKKGKVKEECCEKYKKSGKYCKDCPFRILLGIEEKEESRDRKKGDKNKKKR